ncbi:MAG: dihydrofolate reductase [Candidatus Sericytochromatia bacterium]|nr:dihydrofolate reductase [Candidatus Sericytochromatia bacterium]
MSYYRELIYHVACSLNGMIAGVQDNLDLFFSPRLCEGPHVDDFLKQIKNYQTVLMGRRTYEAGYAFGLQPGQIAYPGREHLVFSSQIRLPADSLVQVFDGDAVRHVRMLKHQPGGPIWLCGGGALAGSLYQAGLIDRLILKLNPVVLGRGVSLLGECMQTAGTGSLKKYQAYDNGVILLEYQLNNS